MAQVFGTHNLMRVCYAFTVVGITVMVSQFEVQFDEFTNSLLVLRFEEMALGAAIAAVTVLCNFTLRTCRVARHNGQCFLGAVDDLTTKAVGVLGATISHDELRAAVRATEALTTPFDRTRRSCE